jgi:hypothetical protein
MAEQERNIAILFVEVIDSARAHEPLKDAVASAEVGDCLVLIQQLATELRGRIIKTVGDGAMCEFRDADAAVLAACEMQGRLQQKQFWRKSNISIRIGLHCGPPLTAGVTAQRMAVMAASGQIITTGETKALLAVQPRNAIRQHVLPARSKPETVTVYEILWQPDHDSTQMPGSPALVIEEVAGPRLRLIHAGREIVVTAAISFGRRPTHGIVLANPIASRDHANIERRKDKFVLIDHSSHGTYIRLNNGYEHKVSNTEAILRGGGVLSFAQRAGEKGAELVSFWCETEAVATRGGKRP